MNGSNLMSPPFNEWTSNPSGLIMPSGGLPNAQTERRPQRHHHQHAHRKKKPHHHGRSSSTKKTEPSVVDKMVDWISCGAKTDRPAFSRVGKPTRQTTMDDKVPLMIKGLGCAAGGLCVCTSIYNMYPVRAKIVNLPIFCISFYLVVFGCAVIIIEGKHFLPPHNSFREWFYDEFQFLSHPRGKSLLYSFVACLCLAFWQLNYLFPVTAILFLILAVINMVASFAPRRTLRAAGVSAKDFRTTNVVPHFGDENDEDEQDQIGDRYFDYGDDVSENNHPVDDLYVTPPGVRLQVSTPPGMTRVHPVRCSQFDKDHAYVMYPEEERHQLISKVRPSPFDEGRSGPQFNSSSTSPAVSPRAVPRANDILKKEYQQASLADHSGYNQAPIGSFNRVGGAEVGNMNIYNNRVPSFTETAEERFPPLSHLVAGPNVSAQHYNISDDPRVAAQRGSFVDESSVAGFTYNYFNHPGVMDNSLLSSSCG